VSSGSGDRPLSDMEASLYPGHGTDGLDSCPIGKLSAPLVTLIAFERGSPVCRLLGAMSLSLYKYRDYHSYGEQFVDTEDFHDTVHSSLLWLNGIALNRNEDLPL
jgi:hypothetical protein